MVPLLRWGIVFWTGVVFAQDTVTFLGNFISPERSPIAGVQLRIEGTLYQTVSSATGEFRLEIPSIEEDYYLLVSHPEYHSQRLPLKAGQKIIQWENHMLFRAVAVFANAMDVASTAPFFDDSPQLAFGTLLHARRRPFLNAVAFHFSQLFFKPQGFITAQQEVFLNGIPATNYDSGNPQWAAWGGLNDFTNATQQNLYGLSGESSVFGGLLGTVAFRLFPSSLRTGTKLSMALSNASYTRRLMASHVGPLGKKINYGLLLSHRSGEEGYVTGTPFQSLGMALLLEAFLNRQLSARLSLIYTPTKRGQNAPLTQEVFDIKGRQYNPYWGWWKGKKKTAREKTISLPQLYLNMVWDPKPEQNWEWALKLQKGHSSTSRIFYNGTKPEEGYLIGGGANPSPLYYQKLPSYFLRNQGTPDFESAYWAREELKQRGQINWEALYRANQQQDWAIYALTKGVVENTQLATRISHNRSTGKFFHSRAYLFFAATELQYYATPKNLFEAKELWNTNSYAPSFEAGFNDLNNPKNPVGIGAPFDYHYSMKITEGELGVQMDFEKERWAAFLGLRLKLRSYQRKGHFKNGAFPETSFGRGTTVYFRPKSVKAGLEFAPSGRQRFALSAALVENAPTLRQAYLQPRLRDLPTPKSTVQQTTSMVGQYFLSLPKLQLQLTAFGHRSLNGTQSRYYYADGIGGDRALFVQEVMTTIARQQLGVELGSDITLTDVLNLQVAANYGRYQFTNNPQLLLAATPTAADRKQQATAGVIPAGTAKIKGYFTPAGPQQAYHLGLQYSDPKYWRLGVAGNYFADHYINFNPLNRTSNFYTDTDGHPFVTYDSKPAAALLRQEKLPPTFLVNLTFNKSWRVQSNYFGVFVSVQNLLNTTYKTGGFEQGRNSNFKTLVEDQQRLKPLFAPKYWWGRGTTFFSSFYYRF